MKGYKRLNLKKKKYWYDMTYHIMHSHSKYLLILENQGITDTFSSTKTTEDALGILDG